LNLLLNKVNKNIQRKRIKKNNEFTGDVVGINLLSQIIQVRKCMGFVALHCGHKIFVLNKIKFI
jgi:hypothetical protein